MSRINSDDANEFQEVKRRLKKSDKKADFRKLLLIVAVVAVFQLGIAAGIIITKKKDFKRYVEPDVPKPSATLNLPQQPIVETPPAAIPPAPPPVTEKAVAVSAETKPGKRAEVRKQPDQRKKQSIKPERAPKAKRQTPRIVSAFPLSIDVAGGDIGRAYAAGMRTIIERHRENPISADGSLLEGRCLIVCIIRRDGSLKHAEVIRTSGNPVLDAAALRSVHKAGKFPVVPDQIPGEVLSFRSEERRGGKECRYRW